MMVPSGRVTLAVEKDCVPAVPVVIDEPALEDVEPLPDCTVVVVPPAVVEDDTRPPPAVTDVDDPFPAELPLSMTLHVVPSLSLMVSLAKAAPAISIAKISGRAKALLCENDAEVITGPPEERTEALWLPPIDD